MLSERIKQLQPSPTLVLDSQVKALQKAGKLIINLSLGEPDAATPEVIANAGIQAIKDGFTHYTAVAGIPELRLAIAHHLNTKHSSKYTAEQVIVGVGSKSLLYLTFQALCNPGDEVLVATPTWSTYLEQIKLAGGVPIAIPLATPFILTAEECRKKITSKTKIILLNSPANPTGAIIPTDELARIAILAKEHNLLIVSDEIYDEIYYNSPAPCSIISVDPSVADRTILINGFSKAYAMTGWRIGYLAAPLSIVKAVANLQGQITSSTSSISQKAALSAIQDGNEAVKILKKTFSERRDFVAKELAKIPGLEFSLPDGAFYFFVSVQSLLNKNTPTATDWCTKLLEQEKVAVVPGEAFAAPGYVRLSFAASLEELQKGLEGIKRFVTLSS